MMTNFATAARERHRFGALQRDLINNLVLSVSAWFDAISEGEALRDGGIVETTYNERDQPLEKRVVDDQGTLLYRVEYFYDANGRLSEEKLFSEIPPLPRAFRDQIPIEQRAAVLAERKKIVEEMAQRTGRFGSARRAYVYNERGHIAERHMRMGPIREDLTLSHNEHGDISELKIESSGFPDTTGVETQSPLKCHRVYEYDSFGNWTSMTETSEFAGNLTTRTQIRQLTYHQ